MSRFTRNLGTHDYPRYVLSTYPLLSTGNESLSNAEVSAIAGDD